ncbi:unnamed protein product [Nesidiocoris tenuis]|uniref:Uncharacterized protein n=1 Tax=Nesidiocoris tenuis TaxID=355587 RepID=A0A6H5GM40_9HEMI|nr:unnamed protein product [Nesidiocoris tenuis]
MDSLDDTRNREEEQPGSKFGLNPSSVIKFGPYSGFRYGQWRRVDTAVASGHVNDIPSDPNWDLVTQCLGEFFPSTNVPINRIY